MPACCVTFANDGMCASGFGQHLARPLFREKHRDDMSEEEARQLLQECLQVGSADTDSLLADGVACRFTLHIPLHKQKHKSTGWECW